MPNERPEKPPALKLEAVQRHFRTNKRLVTALDGISAEVEEGTVTGLIGPDGAGKTTLMRLIAGLLRLDGGSIQALGIDVSADPLGVQGKLGYMPQRFGLYEDLSVQENLDLYADLQGVAPSIRPARYAELLHMTGLGSFTQRMAGRLSGGMKQKLGLACTLLHPPELLLLDEPTVGVDPVSRRELWQIIEHLMQTTSLTVLFSTAYLDEAERCDAVLLLHEGRLLGSGKPGEFTKEIQGRSYLASSQLSRRRLQARLSDTPGVIDAIIQGSHVRVITASTTISDPAGWIQEAPDLSLTPTPPRFEDSFVARLHEQAPETGSPVRDMRPSPKFTNDGDNNVISVNRLSRRFGDFVAVNDISFSVNRGQIFGLLGANGAGKSTTFRMLCGLLPPSSGSLQVAGYDLRKAAAAARGRIGYMAQKFSLYGDLSVHRNLRFFSSAYRLKGARQQDRIDWAIQEFDLKPILNDTSKDLPLGFKQRLALACALMHEPDILFLDEPTSGVDPLARREFWRRINGLAESGVTVLVTTHFMEEAEYCDQLVIMAQGRILATGAPENIKRIARTPETPDPTMEDAFIAVIETPAEADAT